MIKILLTILFCAVFAFAQSGFSANKGGIHVPSARTLTHGELFVLGGFELTSSKESASLEGYLIDENGKNVELSKNSPSNTMLGYVGYGIFDNFEVGLNLNFHYDGDAGKTKLKGLGFGDLGLMVKVAPPNQKIFDIVVASAALEIFIPTGTNEKGLRPRHLWYMHKDNASNPYSASDFALAGTLYLTFNINKYISWNNYAGYLRTFENEENIFVWGTGLNMFAYEWISLVLETSGETTIRSKNVFQGFLNDQLRFSPGLKIRLPKRTTLAINADLGMDLFRKRKVGRGHPITVKNKGHEYSYTVAGSPSIAASIKLSRSFDLSRSDSDGDGVDDKWDLCPQSNLSYKVDRRGCTVDSDGDGIADDVDKCPNTEAAVLVDPTGCPEDLDGDGIPNHLDKCPGTRLNDPVDEFGCIHDEDGDGIHDGIDKCPGTPESAKVDNNGCLLDADKDGIPDIKDTCPNTPAGLQVDEYGCFLDNDKDGVPNELDKCPNSKPDEAINKDGCPVDTDEDGVPDFMDLCQNTPKGAIVNSVGCRIDSDKDGVFDDDDKCPKTPKDAPVDTIGCPIDSDHDGIYDYLDNCPYTIEKTQVDKSGCPIRDRQNMDKIARRIQFHKGTEQPLNSSYTALSDIVSVMRHNKDIAVEIQCSLKEKETDDPQELSNARANFIYEFLLFKGIKEERLKAKGYGLELPSNVQGHTMMNPVGVRLLPYKMTVEE